MKYKLTLFLLILTISAKASFHEPSEIRRYALYGYVAAFCSVPLFNNFWYDSDKQLNGFYTGIGVDPRMLFEEGLDLRWSIFYHHDRFEPGATLEVFDKIGYTAISLDCKYQFIDRKFGLLSGMEYSRIFNQNKEVGSVGVNAEFRFIINSRLSLGCLANVKTREEISKDFVYSTYLSINVKL